MLFTPSDVAKELNRRYSLHVDKIAKGKRGVLWKKIVEDLFNEHGERLGYENLSLFTGLMKELTAKSKKGKDRINDSVLPQKQKRKKFFGLPDGEGLTSFTQKQISIHGLNPDSY